MGVYWVNRILSGISLILSFFLLSTCIWTLTCFLYRETQRSKHPKECKYDIDPCIETHASTHHPSLDDEHNYHEAVVITAEPRFSEYMTEFDEMNSWFRMVMMICLCGAIGASIVQFISSIILICSPPWRLASKTRKIVGVLFATFVIYLVCFGWPLMYDRETKDGDDQLNSMTMLNSKIHEFISDFNWKNLLRDLNFYYLNLFVNLLFLFLYMVCMCCLLRWSDYPEDANFASAIA